MVKFIRTYGFFEPEYGRTLVSWTNTNGIRFKRTERPSEDLCFPNHAVAHFNYSLGRASDPKSLLRECAEFARDYMEPGAVLLGIDGKDCMLTQSMHMNIFASYPRDREFIILFNARPTSVTTWNKRYIIDVGYDRYGVEWDPDSIIMWNAELYKDVLGDKYRLWGIYNNTEMFVSFTDDVLACREDGILVSAL